MVKRLIICASEKDIARTIALASPAPDHLVLAFNENTVAFTKNNIKFKTLQNYNLAQMLSTLPRLVYEHYVRWGELDVGNKKLKDMFSSSGFDFWANVQATFCDKLYVHKTPGLKFVSVFKEIFSAETPDEVFADTSSHAGRAARIVATGLGIHFKPFRTRISKISLHSLLARISHSLALAKAKKINFPVSERSGKKRIMFVLPLASSLQIVLPVIETLKEKFEIFCLVVELSGNESLSKQLAKKNIPHAQIQSYYSKFIGARVDSILKKCGLPDLRGVKFNFLGFDVVDLVNEVFSFYFGPRKYLREVALVQELFKNAIITEQPKLIVTIDESSDLSKPMLDYAKSVGIKTLAMQHAFLEQYPAFENTISPSKIAAWGAASAGQYATQGFPAEHVGITGSPKFDSLAGQKFDIAAAAQKYSLDANKQTILFGSQPILESELAAILTALVNYVNANNLQLIIKLHPRDDENFYRKFADGVRTKCVVTKEDLHPLISLSDVIVINSSLVGLEAAILGKPVVLANFSGLPDRLNYVSDGIALGARSERELHEVLSLLLNSQEAGQKLAAARKSFFEKQLCGLDGKALERVVTIIEELVSNAVKK